MKSGFLYLAMFLLILCLPIYFDGSEVYWLWADLPWVPFSLVLLALACLGIALFNIESLKSGSR